MHFVCCPHMNKTVLKKGLGDVIKEIQECQLSDDPLMFLINLPENIRFIENWSHLLVQGNPNSSSWLINLWLPSSWFRFCSPVFSCFCQSHQAPPSSSSFHCLFTTLGVGQSGTACGAEYAYDQRAWGWGGVQRPCRPSYRCGTEESPAAWLGGGMEGEEEESRKRSAIPVHGMQDTSIGQQVCTARIHVQQKRDLHHEREGRARTTHWEPTSWSRGAHMVCRGPMKCSREGSCNTLGFHVMQQRGSHNTSRAVKCGAIEQGFCATTCRSCGTQPLGMQPAQCVAGSPVVPHHSEVGQPCCSGCKN